MKRLAVIALLALAAVPAPARAEHYLFNCRNLWTQNVLVTVEADSVDDARQKLRTNQELIDKYSLEDGRSCAFRSQLKDEAVKKKHDWLKALKPVSPSE